MANRYECIPVGKYSRIEGGYAYKSIDFQEDGVSILKIKNIRHRNIDTSEIDRVSAQIAKETKRFYVRPRDILISMTGSGIQAPDSIVGRVARYTGPTEKYLINQRVGRFVIKDQKRLYDRFLYYFLSQRQIQWKLVSIATGSANQVNISSGQIEGLMMPLPLLSEQKAIAHILGNLDDKIDLNRRMNEILEAMASAVFKSWFVDFEFPNEKGKLYKSSGGEMVNSELGKIPKEWKVRSVSNYFDLTMGQSPPGETYNEIGEGIPFFQGRRDFGFRYPSLRIYCTGPTRFAEADDTLVSVRAPVGDINMAMQRCCIGRGIAAIKHKSGSRSYTYYMMHHLGNTFAQFEAEGTVFGSITKDGFRKMKCIAPPDDMVGAFEKLAYPIDQMLEINEKQSETLASIRDELLPKLLSGEIRIKDADKKTVEVL